MRKSLALYTPILFTLSITAVASTSLPGIDLGIRSTSSLICSFAHDSQRASKAFKRSSAKLQNINQWGKLMLPPGQGFRHFDSHGRTLSDRSLPKKGNFIRIDPGFYFSGFSKVIPELRGAQRVTFGEAQKAFSQITKKYFWVQIQSVSSESGNDRDRTQVVVRPSRDPHDANKSQVTKHMFNSRATNVFTIERVGSSLRLAVEGSDEVVNLDAGLSPQERLVNTASAAMAWGPIVNSTDGLSAGDGLQKLIWGSFLSSAVSPRDLGSCELR